jgi:hypothetical protein
MGARVSAPLRTGPGAHPASCTMGTGSFPGVKSGRGVTMTPHTLLVPWSWKSRAIPLLPLWAVRPVQNFSACTRVHLYLYSFHIRLSYSTSFRVSCTTPYDMFLVTILTTLYQKRSTRNLRVLCCTRGLFSCLFMEPYITLLINLWKCASNSDTLPWIVKYIFFTNFSYCYQYT